MSGSFKKEPRQKKDKSPKKWLIATLVTSLPNSSPSVQNPKAISRHMEKYHKDILVEGIKRKNDAVSNSLKSLFSKKIKTDLQSVSPADQKVGEARLVRWIAESLRPFSIVEDDGFKEFSEFLCNVNGRFVIPSRF